MARFGSVPVLRGPQLVDDQLVIHTLGDAVIISSEGLGDVIQLDDREAEELAALIREAVASNQRALEHRAGGPEFF